MLGAIDFVIKDGYVSYLFVYIFYSLGFNGFITRIHNILKKKNFVDLQDFKELFEVLQKIQNYKIWLKMIKFR